MTAGVYMPTFLETWMQRIDGEKRLSELTIPGTHDSGTYRKQGISSATCQTLNIIGQLTSGIRFLDIRLKRGSDDDGVLWVYHGPIPMDLRFKEDVLVNCQKFLDDNPSETIVMSIKNEMKDPSQEEKEDFFEDVWKIISDSGRFCTDDQVPKLKDVRGRIVLFRRFWTGQTTYPVGLNAYDNWPEDNEAAFSNSGAKFYVQDRYYGWSDGNEKSDKFNYWVEPAFLKASASPSADTLFVNFTSGTGILGGSLPFSSTPRDVADVVNPLAYDYVKEFRAKRYGIVPMDFPEMPDRGVLSKKLIDLNVFIRNDLNGKRLRNSSTEAVYLVVDGTLHHVLTAESANRIFGQHWGIDESLHSENITNGPILEDAGLVKFDNGAEIFLSFRSRDSDRHVIRHIPNMALKEQYGLNGTWTNLPEADRARYILGAPLPA